MKSVVRLLGKILFRLRRLVWIIAGKKGYEGFESSSEASSYISWSESPKASCCDTEVYASSCSGSGSSKGSNCEHG